MYRNNFKRFFYLLLCKFHIKRNNNLILSQVCVCARLSSPSSQSRVLHAYRASSSDVFVGLAAITCHRAEQGLHSAAGSENSAVPEVAYTPPESPTVGRGGRPAGRRTRRGDYVRNFKHKQSLAPSYSAAHKVWLISAAAAWSVSCFSPNHRARLFAASVLREQKNNKTCFLTS